MSDAGPTVLVSWTCLLGVVGVRSACAVVRYDAVCETEWAVFGSSLSPGVWSVEFDDGGSTLLV